jgi:serpin B
MATGDMRLSVAHQTRFALRLASALSSPSSSSNTVFSPLSLHVALSLLAAGAGGATRDQLLAALGGGGGMGAADSLHALAEKVAKLVLADGSEAGGPRVAFGNAVFVDASLKLKPAFEKAAVGKYRAEAQSVDFQKKVRPLACK